MKEENRECNYNQMQVIVSYWITISKYSDQLIFTNVFFMLPWSTSCHSRVGSTLK